MSLRKKTAQQLWCSEHHAFYILRTIGKTVNDQYYYHLFTVNNQNCLSMVLVCSMKIQHLIAIMMCKMWCNVEAERWWHILVILQISPHRGVPRGVKTSPEIPTF
jgi:hypothetical protein